MIKTNIVNDFLVYVIEEYKFLEKKCSKDIMELFTKYNVFDYITIHYNALHTMGGRAIVDDVNLYLENRK